MISVFIVLASTISALNIANYITIENNASGVLNEVIRQGTDEPLPPNDNNNNNGGEPTPGPDRRDVRQDHYFIVSFNEDGSINRMNTEHMFIYTETQCIDLASKVYTGELNGSKYGNLRYKKEVKEDNLTYVAFIDIKETLDNFNNVLLTSILVSTGAYLVLFLLIFFGSKIVFKPTEEAYKNQKRFITNASHELKTPLTIISADIDLIEMDNGKTEWSESIRDQINRLNEMTNQLVTLSKLEEEDKKRFPFEDFSLNEVASKAIESFS